MTRPRIASKLALEARYSIQGRHPDPRRRDWFKYGLDFEEAEALYENLRSQGYKVEVKIIED